MTCKNRGKYCLPQEYFMRSNETPERGPSSKLYLFKSLLTGTLHRKVNAHLVHKWGSCPSWIKFIELWFADFFFFLTSTYLMDVTHTSVTVAHYSIDSGCGEVSLERTYQNQGQVRVWKSLSCDTFVKTKSHCSCHLKELA